MVRTAQICLRVNHLARPTPPGKADPSDAMNNDRLGTSLPRWHVQTDSGGATMGGSDD